MKYARSHLTMAHALVFAAMLAVFTVLTFLATNSGADAGNGHYRRVLMATAGTMSGPLTGAIVRDFQGCCLKFSLQLMAACAPVLLLCCGLQFVGPENNRWFRAARMLLWVFGWLVWFGGGLASFGHALS